MLPWCGAHTAVKEAEWVSNQCSVGWHQSWPITSFHFPLKAPCSSLQGTDSYVMDEEPGCATECQKKWIFLSRRCRVERCNFAASYRLSASVNNIINHNQSYIKQYIIVHVPTVLRALALTLWHFAVSHHGQHIQTLKSFYPMENQPRLFTSRAELYLTIICHRTECPVSPFHLAPVWPWSPTWIWCTHTLASLQSSIDRTHNKQAFILTHSTLETQSINI